MVIRCLNQTYKLEDRNNGDAKKNISDEVWSGRQDLVVSQLPMVGASTIVCIRRQELIISQIHFKGL